MRTWGGGSVGSGCSAGGVQARAPSLLLGCLWSWGADSSGPSGSAKSTSNAVIKGMPPDF